MADSVMSRMLGDMKFTGAVLLAGTALAVAGQGAYHLPAVETMTFLAAVFFIYFVPGSLLCRGLFEPGDGVIWRGFMSIAVGLTVVPMAYRLARTLDASDSLLGASLVVLVAIWLFARFRDRPGQRAAASCLLPELGGLAALVAGVLALLHFSHFGDVVINPDGFLYRNVDITESVFHLGLINSLAVTYPPPSLYAAGSGDFSGYHLGMHLQIELVRRLTGIDTLHLVAFYFPLTYFLALSGLAFAFVRTLGGSVACATLAGLLVYGSDLSYIPGLLLPANIPWTVYFPSTIWSLFTLNGYLPSLIGLFACLLLLQRYADKAERASALLFVLCAIGTYGLKASMGLHIASAAVLASLFLLLSGRSERRPWIFFWMNGATLGLLLAMAAAQAADASKTVIQLAPFSLLQRVLEKLGLAGTDIIWAPVWLVLIVLGTMGVRALGLWAIYRGASKARKPDEVLIFIGVFFVIGYAISETFFIGRSGGLNDAAWFYAQGLMALWFALFAVMSRWRATTTWGLVKLSIVVGLAVPTTVQFLTFRSADRHAHYGLDDMEVVNFLRSTDPATVVLHPLNLDRPSLAANFAGRASVLSPYVSFVTEEDGLGQRGEDIVTFFYPSTTDETRVLILQRYGVNYVYLPADEAHVLAGLPMLKLILNNESLVVFEVQGGT